MVSSKQWKANRIILVFAGIVCIGLALAVLTGGQTQAQVSAFTVNTTFDEQDVYPGDGVCESKPGNGMCSSRSAIHGAHFGINAEAELRPSGVYTHALA